MKKYFFLVITLFIFFVQPTYALDQSVPNNKFGIHVADTSDQDLQRAADLVNSTGGKWGYITLVIQDKDRNHDKWQQVFDKLRALHLIPIIRLATSPDGPKWRRSNTDDVESWANFLDSLRWVVKDRYIVLFNEPNHGTEWDGATDPQGYADVALAFTNALHGKNKDFFVMLAGLDAAAPQAPPNFMDEQTYLQEVFQSKPELKDSIDGLSSHSYPNPGFSGSPYDSGRSTIRNYQWELAMLKDLGISKDLPVFITESGWPHSHLSSDMVGEYMKTSYENVWGPDDRVRAVTPFVLNYQGEPFSQFSWVQPGGDEVYPQYSIIHQAPKLEGEPEILEKGSIIFSYFKELLVSSTYHFQLKVINLGEAIWHKDDGYQFKLDGIEDKDYFFSDIQGIKPGESQEVDLYLKTDSKQGDDQSKLVLYKKDKKILEGREWTFKKLPLPKVQFSLSFFPKIVARQSDIEFQIFDSDEQLVYKRKEINIKNNKGIVPEIANIALGEKYRVVVLRPYYLPRQTFVTFKKGTNYIFFKPMLPFDFDNNGKLNWGDIPAFFGNLSRLSLLMP